MSRKVCAPPTYGPTAVSSAPVAGTVSARNEALESQPELINSDPYGEGWIIDIEVADPAVLDTLLDAESYRALLDES